MSKSLMSHQNKVAQISMINAFWRNGSQYSDCSIYLLYAMNRGSGSNDHLLQRSLMTLAVTKLRRVKQRLFFSFYPYFLCVIPRSILCLRLIKTSALKKFHMVNRGWHQRSLCKITVVKKTNSLCYGSGSDQRCPADSRSRENCIPAEIREPNPFYC